MQAPFDNIVQHLFHQPSLHSVTVDELENMAAQHPYFAAAHFLLLKKMQDLEHPHFSTQLHKTTLYFNNPLWLQFLLQPETVANFRVLDKAPFISNETAAPVDDAPATHTGGQEMVNETAGQTTQTNTASPVQQPAEPASQDKAPHTGMMDVISAVFDDGPSKTDPPVFESTSINSTGAITHDAWSPAVDETVGFQPATSENTLTGDNAPIPEAVVAMPEYEEPAPATAENTREAAVMENPEPITEPAIEHPAETVSSIEEPAAQQVTESMPDPIITAESNQAPLPYGEVPVAEPNGPDNTAEIPEAAASKDGKPLFKTVIETVGAKNDFLFEPYHTVDYFASQGIKLSKMEADSKDKLGRQLRSFTEWLKSMKKLPQVSIDKILSENEESKVVADAIHSIENKEVITEAMAEVFEKQGMAGKAVEVYQKLSLQNPAKSAYFAAKIDVLKH